MWKCLWEVGSSGLPSAAAGALSTSMLAPEPLINAHGSSTILSLDEPAPSLITSSPLPAPAAAIVAATLQPLSCASPAPLHRASALACITIAHHHHQPAACCLGCEILCLQSALLQARSRLSDLSRTPPPSLCSPGADHSVPPFTALTRLHMLFDMFATPAPSSPLPFPQWSMRTRVMPRTQCGP